MSEMGVKLGPRDASELGLLIPQQRTCSDCSGHVRFVPTRDLRTAAKKDYYSTTSSASASKVGGTATPSAFAVLRLSTKTNLLACSIGRSAGLAPFKIFAA